MPSFIAPNATVVYAEQPQVRIKLQDWEIEKIMVTCIAGNCAAVLIFILLCSPEARNSLRTFLF